MDWRAQMVASDDDFGGAPLLRREFDLEGNSGQITSATLHLTALGVVEASINGQPVGDEVLAPGWTSYEWRLRYRSHEVTALLAEAAPNQIQLALGNGWYRGRLGFTGDRAIYGEELCGFAQLEIEYADGHHQVIATDESWAAGPSHVTANDLYDGQTIDARPTAGKSVGVHALEFDTGKLTAAVTPPIRRHESIRPQRIWTSPSGATLLDFGVNLVGWVRFRVQGDEGTSIIVRHAEVLEDGELGTRPLRTARATDQLILSGNLDHFEPTFTTHGFRYAEITGWPGDIDLDDVEAVVVHSDVPRIGHFTTSDPLLNQLHDNVVRSIRGNAVGVPTDCPQRDERLGWTGDLNLVAPAAAYAFDVLDFLRDWLADLWLEQRHAGGRVPLMAPDPLKFQPLPADLPSIDSAAIWNDAAVWVPWTLWQAYGDDSVLRDQWPSMCAYVDRVAANLSDRGLWEHGFQFGDWLDPQAPPDKPEQVAADSGVVATAYFFRSVTRAAAVAEVIGLGDEQARLHALAQQVRSSFNKHYVDADARILSDCPTAYALAIVFGLLDEDARHRGGARLADLVAANDYTIATGFAGTPFVTEALTMTGHLHHAYRLLLQTECPSWLYPVTMGATTMWERWDSMLPDGSVNPGTMTSFNHHAHGAVADWMHRTIGGIAPLEPGYRRILVAPQPGGGLTWAESRLATPSGEVRVGWRALDDRLTELDVTVPAGTTALVQIAGGTTELAPGTHHLTLTAEENP